MTAKFRKLSQKPVMHVGKPLSGSKSLSDNTAAYLGIFHTPEPISIMATEQELTVEFADAILSKTEVPKFVNELTQNSIKAEFERIQRLGFRANYYCDPRQLALVDSGEFEQIGAYLHNQILAHSFANRPESSLYSIYLKGGFVSEQMCPATHILSTYRDMISGRYDIYRFAFPLRTGDMPTKTFWFDGDIFVEGNNTLYQTRLDTLSLQPADQREQVLGQTLRIQDAIMRAQGIILECLRQLSPDEFIVASGERMLSGHEIEIYNNLWETLDKNGATSVAFKGGVTSYELAAGKVLGKRYISEKSHPFIRYYQLADVCENARQARVVGKVMIQLTRNISQTPLRDREVQATKRVIGLNLEQLVKFANETERLHEEQLLLHVDKSPITGPVITTTNEYEMRASRFRQINEGYVHVADPFTILRFYCALGNGQRHVFSPSGPVISDKLP